MSVLSDAEANTFYLISLGEPGVGKTVFLIGSYTELSDSSQFNTANSMRVECINSQPQAAREILYHISRTAQYPSATKTATTFDFTVRDTAGERLPRCRFRWQDVPGDHAQLTNPDFQASVLQSHGGFVFISADAFKQDPANQPQLKKLIEQTIAIASLAAQHNLVFPLAIIFTQCDRLDAEQANLKTKLQSLLTPLKATGAVYQSFSSALPITSSARWQPVGAAAPLLWLLSELTRRQTQPPQNLGDGLRKSLATGHPLWRAEPRVSATVQRYLSILALANTSLQALPVAENLAQEQPELEWDFNLASLYESRGQKERAELVYTHILTQHNTNLRALLSKALLRHEQGDLGAAKTLLQQAFQAAPNRELQAKIYTITQQTLGQAYYLTSNTDVESAH